MRSLCDKCEYVATSASHLKRYIESKHEGVRYPCDKYEYAAAEAGSLKRHIKSKHEGVIQWVPKTWDLEDNLGTCNRHSNKIEKPLN